LRAVIRHTGGTHAARHEAEPRNYHNPTDRNRHPNLDAHFNDLFNLFCDVKKRWAILLIALAVCASYAPAVRDGFVWDDHALVLRDPLIRSWRLIPEGFQHFLFTDATPSDFYRPIQRLTYTLEYCAFAFRPSIFHITSILCHLAAAIAFFFFADELLRALGTSERKRRVTIFFATLLWAIHPIQSSAVIYISGRADPLAATFGFAGLYCGIRSLRGSKGQTWLLITATTTAFLLSALSKEIGLIFPLLWLVTLALQGNWISLRNAAVVAVFVSVVYLSLRFPADHIPPPPTRTTIPALVRPLLVARAVAEYAGLLILPLDLHMDREVETHPTGFSETSVTRTSWRELQTLLGILLIAGVIYWTVRARGQPAVCVCLLLAAISYLPVSGIFLLNATVAEHWMYLPSAFLFLGSCLTIESLIENWRLRGKTSPAPIIAGATVLWIALLAGRTFIRTSDWKDQQTFLETTIAQGGDSSRMLTNLGTLELREGKLDAAKKHLEIALQKDSDQPFALLNLAAVAIKQNDFKLAHEMLRRALESPLTTAKAQELLAVLENKETGSVNVLRMRLASRTGPPDWAIEKRYVKVLDESSGPDRAITELKLCVGTQWYRAESWQLLSELLAKTGQREAAARAHALAQDFDVHLTSTM
jgi:tetratricopeptide (TPR) repeat protein